MATKDSSPFSSRICSLLQHVHVMLPGLKEPFLSQKSVYPEERKNQILTLQPSEKSWANKCIYVQVYLV